MFAHTWRRHWGLDEDPFVQEDADKDPVLARVPLEAVHSSFDRLYGSPDTPGPGIVFGEKGSGKSGLRLAMRRRLEAEAAQTAGKFDDEVVAFTIKTRKGDIVVDKDEYIRHGATMGAMQKLRPAFTKDGSVTAANASGLNDGAAGVLLMSADEAEKRGIEPMARIASYATAGLDPAVMGVGPIYASRKALDKAGWKVDDLDLVEANEAFAAQACAVNKDMGWDPEIVNVNGGAIAIGHPIGASGARVLNTLLFEMKRRDAKKGLATLCIGGGMGVALCVERP